MKRILITLIIFVTSIVFAQESIQSDYTNTQKDSATGMLLGNNYTRIVGGGEKNYPLTIDGLQNAIASLDSGIVYISYPGLWDTTGLGAIPNKITLYGYIKGEMVFTSTNDINIMYNLGGVDVTDTWSNASGSSFKVFDDSPSNYYTAAFNTVLESPPTVDRGGGMFYLNVSNANGSLTSLTAGSSSLDFFSADSTAYNANNAQIFGHKVNIEYQQAYQRYNLWSLNGLIAWIDFYNGADTLAVASGRANIIHAKSYAESNIRFTCDLNHFYSAPLPTSSKFLNGKYGYHFYGDGNSPSWFGGNVNALGYNYFTDAQATDAYVVTLAGAHTLVAGLEVTFKANTANTDGATLKVNSLTVKNLMKWTATGATALATGDIIAGQIVKAVYDGTQWQVISRLTQ